MKTESFEITIVRDTIDPMHFRSREVAIANPVELDKAGSFYFKEPGMNWEFMDEDEILLVGRSDWCVARLQRLVQQDSQLRLDEIGQSRDDTWRACFDVVSNGESVADLFFCVARGTCGWAGQADSSAIVFDVCSELQQLLLEAPADVEECLISIPGRKTPVGWTGRRFKSQKKLKRPPYYAGNAIRVREESIARTQKKMEARARKRIFSVNESNYDMTQNSSRRMLRFTDVWPPIELCGNYPNWSHALDEEGRPGQDESTLKPSKTQSYISDHVDVTFGEVWLPNDDCLPGLIHLGQSEPDRVAVVRDKSVIEFDCWQQFDGLEISSQLTEPQRQLFPMRVATHLSRNPRNLNDRIQFIVDDHGRVVGWE